MTDEPQIHGRSGPEWSEAERPAGGGGGVIAALALIAAFAMTITGIALLLSLLT